MPLPFRPVLFAAILTVPAFAAAPASSPAALYPVSAVRILPGPFADALAANRAYLLAHDPDRLLAPFRREAGLTPRQPSYGDWENIGLDGHTAGHYLSALAGMVATTGDAELRRRLDYTVAELALCQEAAGDGYLGGIPGGRAFWADFAAGKIRASGFDLNGKWVPWYNLHKTFAGLRDAYLIAGVEPARDLLVRYGDWCERVTSSLTDPQMQDMLRAEHGGMNEVLADIHAITGDEKYLRLARRFHHQAILEPLARREDRLTGQHANTQIPKVIGLQRVAALSGDTEAADAARFFWQTVTRHRSVAFGGNSVAEHFNDPADFHGMLEHREGPETCNTHNLLRLSEQLFTFAPDAAYADYYERALYNHILASIHVAHPGYVYFTPIRPGHYRVYSQPEKHFWCCVGSGMENPGRYGAFIYAHDSSGVYVNLWLASELHDPARGLTLRQDTAFPDQSSTRLTLGLARPATFALRLRHPSWVAAHAFAVRVNGENVSVNSIPGSYATLTREWREGDRVQIELPMQTTVERLPGRSDYHAIMHGPIVLASTTGDERLDGLRAGEGRRAHVAEGPLVPLDQLTVLVTPPEQIPAAVTPIPDRPLAFRFAPEIVRPLAAAARELVPFFRLHDARYQLYWRVTSSAAYADEQTRLAAAEETRRAQEAATLDYVSVGEQQPEVDHRFAGEDTETGTHEGRRWRHGRWFRYDLSPRGATAAELVVTYWGGDRDRRFDILVNDVPLATESLDAARPGEFFEVRYPIPRSHLAATSNEGTLTIKFAAHPGRIAGGVYDVRLMRAIE